jgi:hypothetical protein
MKRILLISGLLIGSIYFLAAQSQIGVKLGVSSYDLPTDVLELNSRDLKLSIEGANYGIHFGLYGRIGILGFYLQPEVLFNSNSVQYRVDDFDQNSTIEEIRTEKYQNIDIPVLVMFAPSIFRVYAGPVGHYFLYSSSALSTIEGFKEEFKTLKYGYQAGLGIQIGALMVDARYEGNFNKYGDHITIDGEPFSFSSTPSRIMISLAFKL